MGVAQQYLTLQAQLTVQYGELCVLVMQEGNFYEIYGYDIEYCTTETAKVDKKGQQWNHSIGHPRELAKVLSLELGCKRKLLPHGINNPLRIGFPMITFEDKYLPLLMANDYVVVRMEQYVLPGSTEIQRKIVEIHSPVMQVEHIAPTVTTAPVIAIYLEYCKCKSNKVEGSGIVAGIAVVDIITGATKVSEYYSSTDDREISFQQLYRFIIAHQPRELIIQATQVPTDLVNNYRALLEKQLELHRFPHVNIAINTIPKEYSTTEYQETLFQHTFHRNHTAAVQIINRRILPELNLEGFQYARTALVLLISYCNQYNPLIASRLLPPETSWINEQDHLILAHNAITQLEIMPNLEEGKKKTNTNLYGVLNQCVTLVGRRLLSERLQNPLNNVTTLDKSYSIIEDIITNGLYQTIRLKLQDMPDIARLQRRLLQHTITPRELTILYNGYKKVVAMYLDIMAAQNTKFTPELWTPEVSRDFNQFFILYSPVINFPALETASFDAVENALDYPPGTPCPILAGHYPELDSQVLILGEAEQTLNNVIQYLNTALQQEKGTAMVRLGEAKGKAGAVKKSEFVRTVLVTTAARAKTLVNLPLDRTLGELVVQEHTKAESQIYSPFIARLTSTIDSARMWIRGYLGALWVRLLQEFDRFIFYQPLVELIAKWDLYQCYAWLAVNHHYYRPTIVRQGDHSYFEITEMRHPFVEKIIDVPYVTNDVKLNQSGWFIYGVNAAGKSCLTQAVALNLIMAQAGGFVPGKLVFYPFRKIITRIRGEENKKLRLSSFEVELTELRTALRQADHYTLVVGDELAKGTETDSATALTIATVRWLRKSKSSYMFATHMHHITDHPLVVECINSGNLTIKHLSVQYDSVEELLIYHRKLQEGPGSAFYGLLVARAMGLPKEFLEDAFAIAEEREQAMLSTKHSAYNAKLFMQQCMTCGSKENLHTHHIKPQQQADAQGMIGHSSKDLRSNLMVLCESCHHQHHREDLVILVQDTSQGIIMKVDNPR